LPITDLKDETATQAVQQALDDKFSVSGGTMTGTVFIASGTLTVGQGVTCTNAQGSCITFPDGTTQNTAPTSTIQAGSTLTVAGLCTGLPCQIAMSSSAVAVATLTLGGLPIDISSHTLELYVNLTSSGTAGTGYAYDLCINGDCGSGYHWNSNGSTAGSGLNPSHAAAGMNARSFNLCPMNSGVSMTLGNWFIGKFMLSWAPSNPKQVLITGTEGCQGNGGANWYVFSLGGDYTGAALPTSISVNGNLKSGNLIGEMRLLLVK